MKPLRDLCFDSAAIIRCSAVARRVDIVGVLLDVRRAKIRPRADLQEAPDRQISHQGRQEGVPIAILPHYQGKVSVLCQRSSVILNALAHIPGKAVARCPRKLFRLCVAARRQMARRWYRDVMDRMAVSAWHIFQLAFFYTCLYQIRTRNPSRTSYLVTIWW